MGNRNMVEGDTMASKMGVHDESRTSSFQLQTRCDQTANVEGDSIYIKISILLWALFW